MNILMMTNTFTPVACGVERSIASFTKVLRGWGHRVIIVCPEFEEMPGAEEDVIRVPAIHNFNGSDFSFQLPIPGYLDKVLGEFQPDVVHSHQPFLLGNSAVRLAYERGIPLVYTHHTLHEEYTHHVSCRWEAAKRFITELTARYANLCDRVISPTPSIAQLLSQRGVSTPIEVVPTGVFLEDFFSESTEDFRNELELDQDRFLIGYIGRLSQEKNLKFLAESVAAFLGKEKRAEFLVAGYGPLIEGIREIFRNYGLLNRLHFAGLLEGKRLISAYRSLNCFIFTSHTETQGVVLLEAMASGVPVVALDAFGSRDFIQDRINGRLVPEERVDSFTDALQWLCDLPKPEKEGIKKAAMNTAMDYSMYTCAKKQLQLYHSLILKLQTNDKKTGLWNKVTQRIKAEWELTRNFGVATTTALLKKNGQH